MIFQRYDVNNPHPVHAFVDSLQDAFTTVDFPKVENHSGTFGDCVCHAISADARKGAKREGGRYGEKQYSVHSLVEI